MQISTTDEDARLLNKGNGTVVGYTVVGYNVQIVVDDKHKLIAASDVTNDGNDQHQLYRMAEMAKEALGTDELEALGDTGYHDEKELALCEQNGIATFVPEPKKIGKMRRCYVSKAARCSLCPLRKKCLAKKAKTRQIYRSEHEEVVEQQRTRMCENKGKMRERSGLVEHPFGTLKHRAGWTHFLVRGFEKVGGDEQKNKFCHLIPPAP